MSQLTRDSVYTPSKAGFYDVDIVLAGQVLGRNWGHGQPGPASPPHCLVSADLPVASAANAVAGVAHTFIIEARDQAHEVLTDDSFFGPESASMPRVTKAEAVTDLWETRSGYYLVQYATLITSGVFQMNVTRNDVVIGGSRTLVVHPNLPAADNSAVSGSGLSGGVAGEAALVHVVVRDAYSNPRDLLDGDVLSGALTPSANLATWTNNGGGHWDASLTVTTAACYSLALSVVASGQTSVPLHMPPTPAEFCVSAAAASRNTPFAAKSCLSGCTAGDTLTLVVQRATCTETTCWSPPVLSLCRRQSKRQARQPGLLASTPSMEFTMLEVTNKQE